MWTNKQQTNNPFCRKRWYSSSWPCQIHWCPWSYFSMPLSRIHLQWQCSAFLLKPSLGELLLQQPSVPSTLFPAKTESLEMLTQNRKKCWHRISGWREAKKSIREKKEKFEEEKIPFWEENFPQYWEEKNKSENYFSNFDRGQWLRLCWCDSGLWGITESLEMLTQNR